MIPWRSSHALAPIAGPASSGATIRMAPMTASVLRRIFMQRLPAAGENGPFVLVGHSLGGPYITIYAKLFGDQVVGLVYVDASHPDQQKGTKAALGRLPKSFVRETLYKFATHLSWTGVVRLGAFFLVGGPNMPNETIKISKAFTSNSLASALAEMDAAPATLDEAGTF